MGTRSASQAARSADSTRGFTSVKTTSAPCAAACCTTRSAARSVRTLGKVRILQSWENWAMAARAASAAVCPVPSETTKICASLGVGSIAEFLRAGV
jgi:hypothetical protein